MVDRTPVLSGRREPGWVTAAGTACAVAGVVGVCDGRG